jgi:hypothetical protein
MGELMRRFVEEADRGQWTLLPECLDDFIDESNPVRVIDVLVDALDLAEMSFDGVYEKQMLASPDHTLPDQNTSKSSRRDGSFGSGLQLDAGHEHRRDQGADRCDRGLRPTRFWLAKATSLKAVLTQPRPISDRTSA